MTELVLKSLNNNTPTFVTFENRSGRVVNLFWLSYQGTPVRYGIIPSGHSTSIDTYVTHPWIARDQHSNFLLHINGQKVFYPETQRDDRLFTIEERDHPHIHIPVFPLVRRCMEVIYLVFGRHIVEGVDIPTDLKVNILSMSPLENVTNYSHLGLVSYQAIGENVELAEDGNGDNNEDDNEGDDDEDGDEVDSDEVNDGDDNDEANEEYIAVL